MCAHTRVSKRLSHYLGMCAYQTNATVWTLPADMQQKPQQENAKTFKNLWEGWKGTNIYEKKYYF